MVGVHCVSLPILDRAGRPVAAISITGPSAKKPGAKLDGLVAMLNEACGYISQRLGFSGDWPPIDKKSEAGARAPAEAARQRRMPVGG